MSDSPGSVLPLLEVRDLHVRFFYDEGTVHAVNGASFDIHPQRTLGIVGESGCGKSVTARSILRILPAEGRITQGEILLRRNATEVDLASLGEESREILSIRGNVISMVFQEPMTAFSPVHTIGEQISEALRLHLQLSKKDAQGKVVEMLARVGVPQADRRAKQYPHELSGGLRQRAMIAMALACDPAILIADEPTTALDVTIQAQILSLIKKLQGELRMAVIFITHDLGVISKMADDVAVMYQGRIVEYTDVHTLFREPRHPYTRALLRSIPSVHQPPDQRLESIRGSVPDSYTQLPGCQFAPRCDLAIAGVCDIGAAPQLLDVQKSQRVACFVETNERLQPAGTAAEPQGHARSGAEEGAGDS